MNEFTARLRHAKRTLKEMYDISLKPKEEYDDIKLKELILELSIQLKHIKPKLNEEKRIYAEFEQSFEIEHYQLKILNPSLLNDLKRPITPLDMARRQEDSLYDMIVDQEKRQEELKAKKKLLELKQENQKIEQQIAEESTEASYYTDPKDKDGIIPLRKQKYNDSMDALNLELQIAKETDDKEKIKQLKSEISRLRSIKIRTMFQNAMIKIPRKINGFSKMMGDLSDGIGKVGNQVGNMDNSNQSNAKSKKKGKKSKSSDNIDDNDIGDFGFNTKNMFDKKFDN